MGSKPFLPMTSFWICGARPRLPHGPLADRPGMSHRSAGKECEGRQQRWSPREQAESQNRKSDRSHRYRTSGTDACFGKGEAPEALEAIKTELVSLKGGWGTGINDTVITVHRRYSENPHNILNGIFCIVHNSAIRQSKSAQTLVHSLTGSSDLSRLRIPTRFWNLRLPIWLFKSGRIPQTSSRLL
jgi:hypothetical protein